MARGSRCLQTLGLIAALPITACGSPTAFSDDAGFERSCAPADANDTDRWRPGCATHRNIVAMTDRPEDLYVLRPEAPRDAMRRDAVIGRYTQQNAAAAQPSPATTSAQPGAKGSD